jgi:PKD repeat protein
MKRLLTILSILSLIVTSCYKDPYADAIISSGPHYVGEDITFTNVSLYAESFEWIMGDGFTSSGFSVVHSYIDPGRYLVSLEAFGHKSGVSVATFDVDVIGSELTIEVHEYYDNYLVSNARVRVYPTLTDWENETNQVGADMYTNAIGQCVITNLSHQRYYVDVLETWHDNYKLKTEDVGYIETEPLIPFHLFIAYVDVYDTPAKKSTNSTIERKRLWEEGSTGQTRPLKKNNFTLPKKKK